MESLQNNLTQTVLLEQLAKISPGIAVAIMVQISLGMVPLYLFGSEKQKKIYLRRKRCCQYRHAGGEG
jgi:alkylation response protein AidB-like acyl-CoA dehydrogenase